MGFLNLVEKEHWTSITRRLRVRGLEPCLDAGENGVTDWQIHGPHQDMNFVVYEGPVWNEDKSDVDYVVVYPRAVYWLDSESHWSRVGPEDRIPTHQVKEKQRDL